MSETNGEIKQDVKNKDRDVVVFMCNECGQGAANTAGVARLGYDPAIKIVRVQCSGQVGPIQIMDAMENGADAVAVIGCCLGACHYFNGNTVSMRRVKLLKKFLLEMGYSDQIVNQYTARAAEGETAVGDFEDIMERLERAEQDGGVLK
ncbi:MAG: hydrogenase iron-sulfur subunit [Promethearchaeota archaeon]